MDPSSDRRTPGGCCCCSNAAGWDNHSTQQVVPMKSLIRPAMPDLFAVGTELSNEIELSAAPAAHRLPDATPTVAAVTTFSSITGTNGNDVILGTSGNDTINGLGGSDTIYG